MSQRAAAKRFNVSRETVRKMLSFSSPPGYRRQSVPQRPKLDGFVAIIDGWLEGDRSVPRKQRHTAKRVFDRLRTEHGFTGGYTIIKDYIREREQRSREMFVPLAHPAGDAQADFGEALVEIGGVEQKAYFFALDLPHSDACYVRAYPAAVAEAWVDGHVHAFAFFGAVPRSIVYDNDRCLVTKILPDGTRQRATLFSAFLSHYVIRDRYARPGKGNEKGNVEGLVGYCRRNFMVPIPKFPTWEAFNLWLEEQCRKRQQDKVRGESETIGERLHLRLDGLNFGLGGRALGLRGRVRGIERQYGGDGGRKQVSIHGAVPTQPGVAAAFRRTPATPGLGHTRAGDGGRADAVAESAIASAALRRT